MYIVSLLPPLSLNKKIKKPHQIGNRFKGAITVRFTQISMFKNNNFFDDFKPLNYFYAQDKLFFLSLEFFFI